MQSEDSFPPERDLHFLSESSQLSVSFNLFNRVLHFDNLTPYYPQEFQNYQEQREITEHTNPLPTQLSKSENQLGGGQQNRANNTIFKTSLSQYRKSILDITKNNPAYQFLRGAISRIYKVKNQSVFPKLLSMVRELSITSQVSQSWASRVKNLLEKKQSLIANGKYTQKRFDQLSKTIDIMNDSIQERKLEKSLDIYWGNYKQHQKYERCKRQVFDFQEDFRLLVKQIKANRMTKTKGSRNTKKGKGNKGGSKAKPRIVVAKATKLKDTPSQTSEADMQ